MSAPLDTASLAERIVEYGPVAHLVTVNEAGVPHVVAVRVEKRDGDLVVDGVGRHTNANAAARPGVTLLWPAPAGRHYSLIVDGTARAIGGGLAVMPTRAVLHRTPEGDPAAPNCITVL